MGGEVHVRPKTSTVIVPVLALRHQQIALWLVQDGSASVEDNVQRRSVNDSTHSSFGGFMICVRILMSTMLW